MVDKSSLLDNFCCCNLKTQNFGTQKELMRDSPETSPIFENSLHQLLEKLESPEKFGKPNTSFYSDTINSNYFSTQNLKSSISDFSKNGSPCAKKGLFSEQGEHRNETTIETATYGSFIASELQVPFEVILLNVFQNPNKYLCRNCNLEILENTTKTS